MEETVSGWQKQSERLLERKIERGIFFPKREIVESFLRFELSAEELGARGVASTVFGMDGDRRAEKCYRME